MTNRAQELIKNFYEEEALRKESEITFSDFNVRLNSSDIAMLDIIAKRFGKTSDRVAADALSAALYSMVEALETSERKQLAKEADELNESLAKKAAKSNGMADYDEKSVTWTMNDRAITREENRRKKEQESNQATQSTSAHTETAIEASESLVTVESLPDNAESQSTYAPASDQHTNNSVFSS
ncbi:hypothetical protein QWZ13_12495 [Reinekea marina]|uniref:Uncharacterized protein n=1 Tax=Reinekea marina TaxID=1310421 RepID=A0ABV7WT64_9GAMM|nr:hypothetical protein [Reinekea marina]MDN3649731.1 hypothetical protein [Reinekea marina]